jgi:hypothetical protein
VRHAVVLVAVVDVAHLPALLHGGGADDGAEGHGERNDDHGEWFHHLGRLGVNFLERMRGERLCWGLDVWVVGLRMCWSWCLCVLIFVGGTVFLVALRKD